MQPAEELLLENSHMKHPFVQRSVPYISTDRYSVIRFSDKAAPSQSDNIEQIGTPSLL